jgi:5-formaminoimidazole-4-carboxamide-1-beta-D-ribofuranosyl 5'-monophosphate synthetase
MKKFGIATVIASGLTAAVLGFAGQAQAGVNITPTGPTYSVDNHDEISTTNGFVDRPF